MEQIAATANRGTTEMMARHNQAIEHLKMVIDQEVRRLNMLVDCGVPNKALSDEAARSFAAVALARAELP
jgi:hypothetical protein